MPTVGVRRPATPTGPSDAQPTGSGDSGVLFTVVAIVAALLATVLVILAVRAVDAALAARPATGGGSERDPDPETSAFDPLDAPALLAEKMAAGAPGQREVLAERLAAQRDRRVLAPLRGAGRRAPGSAASAWETSSEFTLRVLDRSSADARR